MIRNQDGIAWYVPVLIGLSNALVMGGAAVIVQWLTATAQ